MLMYANAHVEHYVCNQDVGIADKADEFPTDLQVKDDCSTATRLHNLFQFRDSYSHAELLVLTASSKTDGVLYQTLAKSTTATVKAFVFYPSGHKRTQIIVPQWP